MQPICTIAIAFSLSLVLVSSVVAQGLPSSKATADINTLVKCNMTTATNDDGTAVIPASCVNLWTGATVGEQRRSGIRDLLSKPVKLSNSQSLFISLSLVSGLYTRTRTKTQDGSTSTAQAMGAVFTCGL